MSDEPTIRDVLEALVGVESNLNAKIYGVETRLTQQIRDTEKRLSNEIAGAYSLHDERISDLERRVDGIERRFPPTH